MISLRMTAVQQGTPRWLLAALGACAVALVVTAALLVGPPEQAASVQSRLVKVQRGVVQSTVSGSGNIQAATQLNLGFRTAGVVQRIYVTQGEYVTPGKLLAELNPQNAEVTLEQAKASLRAAEATLAQEEENGGETSGQSGGTSGAGGKTNASSAEKPKQSLATREANLASARAAVRSDGLAVRSDEESVANTKLFAPENGTIVSLSGEVGENVSGGGTSKASASTSSSSAAGSGSAGGGGASSSGRSSSSAGSASSSSSSSAFAVLSDLATLQLVVPLSESEIVHVHVGRPATVTVEALEGLKLAAHVVSVATLSTSNSGVVSYDVTFQLDQAASALKPGMSASAEVVVKQEEGLNVPTSAISGNTVTVVRNGKRLRQAVLTGLAGNSSTIILSGLRADEEIVLPIASSGGAGSITSRLAGRGGATLGGGLGGGGFPGGGFPGGGFVRGGG